MVDLHSKSIMKLTKQFSQQKRAKDFLKDKCKHINKSRIKSLVSKTVLNHQIKQNKSQLQVNNFGDARINVWKKPIYHLQEPAVLQNIISSSKFPKKGANSNEDSKPHTAQNSQLAPMGATLSQQTGTQGAGASTPQLGPQIHGPGKNIDRASSQTINVDIMELLQNQPIADDKSQLLETNDKSQKV
jgi:hypothetical protein